jgi:hypothetical protein
VYIFASELVIIQPRQRSSDFQNNEGKIS